MERNNQHANTNYMRNIEKIWENEVRTKIGTVLKINRLDRTEEKNILEMEIKIKQPQVLYNLEIM